MKITLAAILAFILMPGYMYCQKTMTDLVKTASTWQGEGYQQMPGGERIEFNQTEVITPLLNQNLLMFNGTGRDKKTGEVGFQAVGIMYQEPESGKTFMHAWTSDGQYTKADVIFGKEGFYWQFEVPSGGKVRYTVVLADDTWKETGAYSPDDSAWYPFFEMKLKKAKP